mgnify:CR=1 FL=1
MTYLKIHEDFLRRHETTPRKKLAELFNAKFKVQVSIKGLSQKCRKLGLVCPNNGCFKKGSIPANKGKKGLTGANKTSFAKGNVPPSTRKVGTISTRKDKNERPYMHIKVAEPNKWQMLILPDLPIFFLKLQKVDMVKKQLLLLEMLQEPQ